MKIITFQYNKGVSAIIQESTLSTATNRNQLVKNRFLENGYEDRFLWEEAASLKPKKPVVYHIPGNWQ
jgi:hypothetical protein